MIPMRDVIRPKRPPSTDVWMTLMTVVPTIPRSPVRRRVGSCLEESAQGDRYRSCTRYVCASFDLDKPRLIQILWSTIPRDFRNVMCHY
jgi:hypothetical protein